MKLVRNIALSAALGAQMILSRSANAISFSDPLPLSEAAIAREIQTTIGTTLSSAELRRIERDILARATFSARVSLIEIVQRLDDLVEKIIAGEMDFATARTEMKKFLDSIGYEAQPQDVGTIKDLRTDARIILQLETNVATARGYGQWIQGQTRADLDQWPAQELYRAFARKQPREWLIRFQKVGGQVFKGRMIALRNSDIWEALGDPANFPDALGNPYPPFAFNSGMRVRRVDRDTAMNIGLIDRDTEIKPQHRGFNEDLQASPDIRSAALKRVLEDEGYTFDGDVLTL